MVTITTPTAKQSIFTVLTGKDYFPVRIQAAVTETNPALTRVGATLDWNDGTPPVIFTPGKPITIDVTRNLFLGTYYITLLGFNYLQPQPQQTAAYFSVEVQPQQIMAVPQEYLFGPILPMDDAFPNAQQWSFNLGTNLDVLKSSVKMLLITTKGERVMQPTYGTLLRRIVFEPSTDSISTIVQQEITEALTQFEPRVGLETFKIQKADSGGRSVIVNATFLSKISQTTFSLALPFTQ
jgi:phage baseplate assembly protein W